MLDFSHSNCEVIPLCNCILQLQYTILVYWTPQSGFLGYGYVSLFVISLSLLKTYSYPGLLHKNVGINRNGQNQTFRNDRCLKTS